jgi:hypothetical protein
LKKVLKRQLFGEIHDLNVFLLDFDSSL